MFRKSFSHSLPDTVPILFNYRKSASVHIDSGFRKQVFHGLNPVVAEIPVILHTAVRGIGHFHRHRIILDIALGKHAADILRHF